MNNRIMVVDDEVSILELFTSILTRNGYEAKGESRVDPAFELYKVWRPFLVICDLRLQNHVDGATLAGMIRREDPYPIIVACTGDVSQFDKGYLLGSGTFTDIIQKPIDIKLLLRVAEYAKDKYERWKSY